ncbi:hypothetical protein ABPG75_000933 [Micractinium tetrahymenae]
MEFNGEADWELVSSSSEEGEGGPEQQQEAEALARSFQAGEPSPPRSGAGGSSPPGSPASAELAPGRGAAGEPAHGSPQRLQRLQLLAAPLPASGWPALPPGSCGASAEALGGGAAAGTVAGGPPGRPASAGGAAEQEAGGSGSSAGDLHLRVVRSDELQALERAVAALEKRAANREQELALAQLRLSGTQAALEAESREAFRLRRLALMAGSVCAFLGLKVLLGGPERCCGASAAAAHSPLAARCSAPGGKAGRGLLSDSELDRMVAVKVEPLN